MNARKFSMSMGRPPDFQTINRIHVKYCCCISFILFNLVSNHLPNFSPIPFTQNSTKIKNLHPLLLFYCTFFCSAHLFFPNKNCLPSCGRLAFEPCERYRLRRGVSCEGHLGTFKPREFTEKRENFMKMIWENL